MKNYYLTFLILMLFWGCANKKTTNQSDIIQQKSQQNEISNGKIKLKWLAQWYGEGDKERFVREIAREFSLQNQDIDLQLDFPDQIFNIKDNSEVAGLVSDTVLKMVQAGSYAWDIFPCDQYKYKMVSEKLGNPNWGYTDLVDFSQTSWFESSHKDGIITNELKSDYGGIVPGPIIEGIVPIMFVSSEVEKMLGISVKRINMNFSDFLGYAKVVADYNKTHDTKITFFSTQYESIKNLATQLIMSSYGELTPPTKQQALDIFAQVYKMLEQLAPYKPVDQVLTFPGMTWNQRQRALVVDRFLFNLQPSWINTYWKQSRPQDVTKMIPCEIPSSDNKISKCYIGFYQSVFVVPKSSKNAEAAERLMKFIASKDIGEKWVNYSKSPTGIKTKLASSDFGQSDYDIFYRHIQHKYGKNQININLSSFFFSSNNSLNFNFEGVLRGVPAEDAIKDLERQTR